jgi:hypothetical protein
MKFKTGPFAFPVPSEHLRRANEIASRQYRISAKDEIVAESTSGTVQPRIYQVP